MKKLSLIKTISNLIHVYYTYKSTKNKSLKENYHSMPTTDIRISH